DEDGRRRGLCHRDRSRRLAGADPENALSRCPSRHRTHRRQGVASGRAAARAAGEGYATATDLADWLVRTLKMPFRDAHHVTGRIVAKASQAGVPLHELPLKEMQAIEPKITAEALGTLSVEASVKSRNSYGGTAPKNVLAQAKAWARRLEKQRKLG